MGVPNPIDLMAKVGKKETELLKGSKPKPDPPPNYINPKLRARSDAMVAAIDVHDPPLESRLPGFRLPPLPGQASLNPAAVTFRMLKTPQAKSMGYGQFHHWTSTAMQYRIPAPELIAAAIATRTPANVHAIAYLAKRISKEVGYAGLSAWLWNAYPDADPVRPIYEAANAVDYVPVYRR